MIRAARIFAPVSAVRLALIDATVIAAVFVLVVRVIGLSDPSVFFFQDGGALQLAPPIAILILAMYFCGLYENKWIGSRIYLLQQLAFCGGIALISQALIVYVFDRWILPRNLALFGLVGSILALFGWRLLREVLLSGLEGTGTVLILGTDETARRIAQYIDTHPAQHLKVAGSLTNRPEKAVAPVLGGISDLRDVVRKLRPALIISGMVDSRDRMPVADLVDLRYAGYRIEEAGTACELICRHVSVRDLRPSRMLFSTEFDAKDVPLAVFLVDAVTSGLLLLAGAPLVLIYVLLMRLFGRRRVIVKEICAGFQGRPFVSRRLLVEDQGPLAAVARALHLQYWPQLWNVLLRRMSMVGPRPGRLCVADELGRLLPVHEYRQNALPGVTGWAQINLKPDALRDAVVEVEYDLYFIRNQSVSLYTYILLHGMRGVT